MDRAYRALFRAAQEAQRKAAALYLHDEGTNLIDIGWRIKESEGGTITNELAVRVHVKYKPRGFALEAFLRQRPEREILPERIGFPVDVIESNYSLQSILASPSRSVLAHKEPYSPLRGGISISHAWSNNYGTLGGIVSDRSSGVPMLLSAWHVLAGSFYVPSGMRIYQPGLGEGGRYRTIASLARHGMSAGIDAAVATLMPNESYSIEQLGIGDVTGEAAPLLDMQVTKSGRTTGITHGIIDGVGGILPISYGDFPRTIRNIVHIAQATSDEPVSAPGDSGSWWLESESRKAIGIHFAGSNDPEYGLAIAMPQVLQALDVAIIT